MGRNSFWLVRFWQTADLLAFALASSMFTRVNSWSKRKRKRKRMETFSFPCACACVCFTSVHTYLRLRLRLRLHSVYTCEPGLSATTKSKPNNHMPHFVLYSFSLLRDAIHLGFNLSNLTTVKRWLAEHARCLGGPISHLSIIQFVEWIDETVDYWSIAFDSISLFLKAVALGPLDVVWLISGIHTGLEFVGTAAVNVQSTHRQYVSCVDKYTSQTNEVLGAEWKV